MAVFVLAVFVLPIATFAGSTKKIYVDDDASGTQDGSQSHPYKTISEALKHANDDDEVHVASGTYKENIKVPEGVTLFGHDKKDTIIDASDNEPAVEMNHKTTIDKFTVKGGSHGVYVSKKSKASILSCIVKDADKDGIHVRDAKVEDKYKVSIIETEVKDNDRAGIFSEKRRVILIENEVHDNGSDGADLALGSKAWVDDNNFRDNNGSGLKLALDESTVFVASKNTFRDNKHEGVEVNTYGKTGTINVKKSKFINNSHYGIARIQRVSNVNASVWQGLTLDQNTFSSNNRGEVSPILDIR